MKFASKRQSEEVLADNLSSQQFLQRSSALSARNKFHLDIPVINRRLAQTSQTAAAVIQLAAITIIPILWRHLRPFLSSIAVIFFDTLLLLALNYTCLRQKREKQISPAFLLVFCLAIYTGPSAAVAVLISYLIWASIGRLQGVPHFRIRLEGAQLALAAVAASAIFTSRLTGMDWLQASVRNLTANSVPAIARLYAAGEAAFTFLAITTLLRISTELRRWALRRTPLMSAVRQISSWVFLNSLGLIPIVFLASLSAEVGLIAGLPTIFTGLVIRQIIQLRARILALETQLKVVETLARANVTDDKNTEPDVLLERFLIRTEELLKPERSLVWRLDHNTGQLTPQVALPDAGNFDQAEVCYGEGIIGHVAARGLPQLIPDVRKDLRAKTGERDAQCWLLYPLVVRHEVLGIAHFVRPAKHPFTSDDVCQLDLLVPQIAIGLENLMLHARLHRLAETDPLTGLSNRYRMMDLLRSEVRRGNRYQRCFSILMIDIDSFNLFNDVYGYAHGDRLLRSLADVLRANIRSCDTAGRFGGEEFLLLLPETGKDDACRLAERIRNAVMTQAGAPLNGLPTRCTISVGVAAYPEDGFNPTELIERADEALQRAKRAGKNCVIWA